MSKNIDVTPAQLALLRKIAADLPPWIHTGGKNSSALTDTRMHEQLAREGLIERIYIDPHDPAHRLTETEVARSEIEPEIQMRWRRHWTVTNLGRRMVTHEETRPPHGAECNRIVLDTQGAQSQRDALQSDSD